MPNYLFFWVPFAFLDYEKAGLLVFLENALTLSAWVFLGAQLAALCLKPKTGVQKRPLLLLGSIAAALMIGIALNAVFPGENISDFASAGWGPAPDAQSVQTTIPPVPAAQATEEVPIEDSFVLIPAGSFLMGSPETENWRITDVRE